MRMSRRWSVPGVAAALALAAAPIHGQAKVVALEKALEPLEETREVVLLRLGTFQGEALAAGAELGVGDELRSSTGAVSVQLTCAGGSRITLAERFRIVVAPAGDKDCSIDLLNGAAQFLSEQPTGGTVGETSFATESTQYEVRIGRDRDGGLRREVNVFDGRVVAAAPERRQVLDASAKLVIQADRWQTARVEPRDVARTAALYARVDASRIPRPRGEEEDVRAAYASLERAHAQVLARPQEPAARVRLAAQQVQYAMPAEALYQLDLAEERTRGGEDRSLHAAALLTRSVAYQQAGEEQKADAAYEDAVQADPRVVEEENLRRYGLSTPGRVLPKHPSMERVAVPPAITVTVSADPPRVRPGQAARIVVRAATVGGEPLAGASVKLAAGGGAFRRGGAEAAGRTDARGLFATSWSCRPCTGALEIGAEVSKPGFATARQSVRIELGSGY